MEELDRNEMRKELLAEKRKLLQKMGIETESTETIGRNPDRADLAQNYSARERNRALAAMEQEQLSQIENALQRLDDGSYGACIQCGDPIAPARLQILPYASLCMKCRQNAS